MELGGVRMGNEMSGIVLCGWLVHEKGEGVEEAKRSGGEGKGEEGEM